jgi:hypothetical protein
MINPRTGPTIFGAPNGPIAVKVTLKLKSDIIFNIFFKKFKNYK